MRFELVLLPRRSWIPSIVKRNVVEKRKTPRHWFSSTLSQVRFVELSNQRGDRGNPHALGCTSKIPTWPTHAFGLGQPRTPKQYHQLPNSYHRIRQHGNISYQFIYAKGRRCFEHHRIQDSKHLEVLWIQIPNSTNWNLAFGFQIPNSSFMEFEILN